MPQIKKKHKQIQLSKHLSVSRYRLMLHLRMDNFTFHGQETIYCSPRRRTRQVIFHAKELAVRSAVLRHKKIRLPATAIRHDHDAETVTLSFPHTLPPRSGEIDIEFDGNMNDRMRGLYRSRYTHHGKDQFLAVTQFEATDARMAFPCVDEPAAKAVFDVTLIVPKGHTAISNTLPIGVSEHESGYQVVRFAPTPKMSTYLLAFIAGNFEWIEKKTPEGVTVRVFATPGKKHQATFALHTAAKILSFYSRYFGIAYPLPVLDMIAIPDFSAGAMENWGAITYRESAILFDPKHSSVGNKQWVALAIAHEIAHQWFGNLVTMEWWTHLWLNEGFASYIEYLAVDHLFPQWDIWTRFVHDTLGEALWLDALASTHPIEVAVHHPNEISEIFDAVSYQKGASVIRMLASYLGERVFRAGIRHYLQRHRYANASTDDLWRAFAHVSGKPIGVIMRAWTRKPGYPLIRVLQTQRGIQLSQSRFFSSAVVRRRTRDASRWPVPLNYRRRHRSETGRLLMPGRVLRTGISPAANEWVSWNAGASGVYRVGYSRQALGGLAHAVAGKELPAQDRLLIQSDAFALAQAGQLPTTAALELAGAYRGEDDYTVWADLATNLQSIDRLSSYAPWRSRFHAYGRLTFRRLVERMGWKKKRKETDTNTLLRSLALANAGAYGDHGTIQRARKMFQAFQKGDVIPADLRNVVYGVAAEHGGSSEYAFLLRRYKAAELHEEKNRIGRALGRFRQRDLLAETLHFAISKHVRTQDTPGVLAGVWTNPSGRDLAWKFIRTHWQLFLERYGEGGHTLPRIIQPAAVFTRIRRAREVRKFFRTAGAPGAERAVEQVIERIESNADWLRRDGRMMARWLARQKLAE